MQLTIEQLAAIAPKAKTDKLQLYAPALSEVTEKYELNTPLRLAHFIAQVAHESGAFNYSSENLNYSAKALRAVFGKYFASDEAAELAARQPEKIANIVYASRMGNGDTASGEGWRYRGRGLIQLTGKDNYRACGLFIEQDLLAQPDTVANDPNVSVAAACWYWRSRQLNQYADQDDVKAITRRINGGYHGLEDREAYLQRAKQVLNVQS